MIVLEGERSVEMLALLVDVIVKSTTTLPKVIEFTVTESEDGRLRDFLIAPSHSDMKVVLLLAARL